MAATHIFPGFTADGDQHLSHALASGRAAALFALLAGVALALASGGRRPPSRARCGPSGPACLPGQPCCVAVGLLLGQVDSPPLVILAYYGLLFVVAVPFLGLSSRPLAVHGRVRRGPRPAGQPPAPPGRGPDADRRARRADLLVELFLTGTYPVLTWTAYLFAGLAVGRLPLRRISVGAQAARQRAGAGGRGQGGLGGPAGRGRGRVSLTASQGRLTGPIDHLLAGGLFGTTRRGTGAG